jgi:hypothetical protein
VAGKDMSVDEISHGREGAYRRLSVANKADTWVGYRNRVTLMHGAVT